MFKRKKYNTEALISAIKSGGRQEEEAIGFLIEKDYGKIENLIVKRNGSVADAEDIFQEALTVLILNIRKGAFKGESTVHTYLYAICKGMWYKRFKKYTRESDHHAGMMVHDLDEETPEAVMLDEEQKSLLHQLFDQLRENCKEVLLYWGMSYSMTEIADMLSFSNAQVAMNKKNKCLKQLKKLMGEDSKVQGLIMALDVNEI
ncbi:sigma-70 family RNA polymerase sigma factor [Fulvivirgaceae bacterium BMA12]|uniref:Sigma-70 family RNA polymerase sigma factor n=1 Tax=Agaribacillus aureus TaxID=3051825 RepID=A0ABT8LG49_9BACT|nr:sigma-70 family RNA polymerase sigma factor [Fulvivirgaceae bacterium BMA12]